MIMEPFLTGRCGLDCSIAFGYGATFTSLCLSWWMYGMQDALTIPITGEKGRIFLLRQYNEARAKDGEESTLASPPTSVSQAGSIQGGESAPLMGDALARSQSDVAVIEPAYSTEELSAEMKQFMRDISDPNNCCAGKSFRKHGLPNKHRLLFGKFLARFGQVRSLHIIHSFTYYIMLVYFEVHLRSIFRLNMDFSEQGPHFVLFLVRYYSGEYICQSETAICPWFWIDE